MRCFIKKFAGIIPLLINNNPVSSDYTYLDYTCSNYNSDRTYQNRIHTDCPNVVDNMDFRRDPEHTGQELPVEARPALSEAWPEVQSGTLDGTWMNNPSASSAMHLKQERTANYRHHLWYRLHTRHLAHLLGRFRRLRRHLWYRIHRPYLRHFSAASVPFISSIWDTALLHPFPVPYRPQQFLLSPRYFNRFFSILLFHKKFTSGQYSS